jgi:Ca-activated chloride channel family protein
MSFQLASPWFLLLLLVLPLLAVISLGLWKGRKPAALHYADVGLARPRSAGKSWRRVARMALPFVRLFALALMIVALSRPQIVNARQIVKGEGVDIALALDISGSMASLDFEPNNRLEAAKLVIDDFIAQRPYDRIGVTVFASEAFSQSPLTIDHNVVSRLLERLDLATELNIDDGTAIGLGLANAANMLKDSQADSRVVILLTDGVNNAGQIDPLTAAEAAKTLGIKVYTIGMGRPGQVPIPQQTLFGEQVVMAESQLDEGTLQQIAEITGGRFFRAYDTAELAQVYDEINRLEKSQIEIQTFNRYQELAAWLLVPAILLLLAEILVRKTVLRQIP